MITSRTESSDPIVIMGRTRPPPSLAPPSSSITTQHSQLLAAVLELRQNYGGNFLASPQTRIALPLR